VYTVDSWTEITSRRSFTSDTLTNVEVHRRIKTADNCAEFSWKKCSSTTTKNRLLRPR